MTKKALVEEFKKDYAEGDDLISKLLTARMNHDVTKEALATCELERFVLCVLQDITVLMDYLESEQTYEEIAKTLCDALSNTPVGCEGCPLGENEEYDEEGNAVCSLLMAVGSENKTKVNEDDVPKKLLSYEECAERQYDMLYKKYEEMKNKFAEALEDLESCSLCDFCACWKHKEGGEGVWGLCTKSGEETLFNWGGCDDWKWRGGEKGDTNET